ncbi:MAG: class I SAM-dependent methyltransferase [Alphaproteobacteria bacterium]|nr:class I SAM-dependent methyltransferase [Alphaproteobacteria bacterium SS10]
MTADNTDEYLSPATVKEMIDRSLQVAALDTNRKWVPNYIQGHYPRFEKSLSLIPKASEHRSAILDVGTEGFMLDWFAKELGYTTVAGTRYRPEGKPSLGKFSFYGQEYDVGNLNVEKERMPFDDASFDVVTCFEVIEHFTSDPMFFFLQAGRVLKPGGLLIMSTPNAASYEALLK